MIRYTALRSIIDGHVEGEEYVLDIAFTRAPRQREVQKAVRRAASGARTETLYLSADTYYQLTFEPVSGDRFDRMVEFLDSVADGTPFEVWIYGDEAEPIWVVRADTGHAFERFMPRASRRDDLFQVSFRVKEYASS